MFRNEWTGGVAEVADSGLAVTLERIQEAWPNNVSVGTNVDADSLFELIANEVIAPSVTPRSLPKAVGEKPEVWAPARLQAARGKVVTNRLHGAVQLEQEPLRRLVMSLDGTKSKQVLGIGAPELDGQLEWLRRAALLAG